MRQETQGDVMMPADPAPHFIMVEADLAFALLNAPLHRPARRAALGQRLFREVGRGVGEEGFELPVGAEATAQDHPDIGAGEPIAHGHRPHTGDLSHQWPLGPLAQEVAPPGRRRQGGGQRRPAASPSKRRGRLSLRAPPHATHAVLDSASRSQRHDTIDEEARQALVSECEGAITAFGWPSHGSFGCRQSPRPMVWLSQLVSDPTPKGGGILGAIR